MRDPPKWFAVLIGLATCATEVCAHPPQQKEAVARSFVEPWEVHPMLVHYPIAFLLSAVVVDLVGWRWPSPRLAWAVRWLLLAGVVSGVFAALAGVIAFLLVPAHTEQAHGLMYWHAGFQVSALAAFACLAWVRWRQSPESVAMIPRVIGWSGALLLVIGSGIGGFLVYHGGAGIEPSLLAAEVREGHSHGPAASQKKNQHSHGDANEREDQAAQHQHGKEPQKKHDGETASPPTSRAPEQLPMIPAPDVSAAQVPAGYRVEIVAKDLAYPTSVAIDDAGALYVAEGGYVYGDDVALARIIRIQANGKKETVAEQLNGPITDLLWHANRLYVSHRGKISVLDAGKINDLVTGLPSLGDHHNNQLAVGPDGKIYFGQGTATNSGVVGLDNFKMGWLSKYPDVRDLSPKDVRVTNQAFSTPDILNLLAGKSSGHEGHDQQPAKSGKDVKDGHEHGDAKGDKKSDGDKKPDLAKNKDSHADHGDKKDPAAKKAEPSKEKDHTGHGDMKKEKDMSKEHDMSMTAKSYPFQPFAKTPPDDGAIRGVLKANGTILRMNPDGSDLEVFAWGLRNPYGLRWSPDGKLYASDNGYDERGSRPIAHAPDLVWVIKKGACYGFPDYAGGIPVTDPRFRPAHGPAPKFILRDHPLSESPLLALTHHAGAAQMEFSRDPRFGFQGQMFLAMFGDMNPITGKHAERSGFMVARIDPANPKEEPFFRAKKNALGPKGLEYVATAGPKRPVGVRFSPDGSALYVVDIGALSIVSTATGPTPRPFPRTGVVWRILRDDQVRR